MRIGVMGAGAVGGYFGGMLARAGHEVVLVGRAALVEAVAQHGLLIDTAVFQERVPIEASTDPSALRDAAMVLFCVKSTDTESAGAQIAPHLAPGASVWCLQNGVDNAERLAKVLGREVHSALVYLGAEVAGPGHVKHHGRGDLVVGAGPQAAATVALFTSAGVPVAVSENLRGALWAKLIINCAWNALSAITQQPYGRLMQGDGVRDVLRDVVAECLAVAQAEGVVLPGDAAETLRAVEAIAQTLANQRSSTAQDLARGRPSEIGHLNGFVVARGAAHGIATPANRVLHTLVGLLEAPLGMRPVEAL